MVVNFIHRTLNNPDILSLLAIITRSHTDHQLCQRQQLTHDFRQNKNNPIIQSYNTSFGMGLLYQQKHFIFVMYCVGIFTNDSNLD